MPVTTGSNPQPSPVRAEQGPKACPYPSVAHALHREFSATVPWQTIVRVVAETARRFEDADYTTFVPTLVHRFARERLQATVRRG